VSALEILKGFCIEGLPGEIARVKIICYGGRRLKVSTKVIRDESMNLLRGGGQCSAEIQTIKRGGARVLSKKRLDRNTKTTLKRILLTDSNVFRSQRCQLLTFPTVQGIANKTKVSDRSLHQRVPVGKVLCPPFFGRKTTRPEGIRRTFVPG